MTNQDGRSGRQNTEQLLNPGEAELLLANNPTLADLQDYVIQLKKLRRFRDVKKNTLICIVAEVGELSAALRQTWGAEDSPSDDQRREISLEMADVLMYLLDLANQYGISLEHAFREKEEINKRRLWHDHHRF